MNFINTCFVVMPFGQKHLGERLINFDTIYEQLFSKAINSTPLPEGGFLQAKRTDNDMFSANINLEMFQYLEYSRLAFVDISSMNANVFYELGARHRTREAGTVIFRQFDVPIPFDISTAKVFSYEYSSESEIEKSRQLITNVLTETLKYNRPDSPIQIAIKSYQNDRGIQNLLLGAENALKVGDLKAALDEYRAAIAIQPSNPVLRLKLGILYKDLFNYNDALEELDIALSLFPDYSDAHREKGAVVGKLRRGGDAIEELLEAVKLNPNDFLAWRNLGANFQRLGNYTKAIEAYKMASEVSKGDTTSLLREIKLQCLLDGKLTIDRRLTFLLARAERLLQIQTHQIPPYNAPWSFFDLAEIYLFKNNKIEFLKLLEEGTVYARRWELDAVLYQFEGLLKCGIDLPGLENGISILKEIEEFL